jgi:hypothetical protein
MVIKNTKDGNKEGEAIPVHAPEHLENSRVLCSVSLACQELYGKTAKTRSAGRVESRQIHETDGHP